MRGLLILTAAVLAAAPATSADRSKADAALAGRVAGAPQRCVPLGATANGPTIVDARTILYRAGSRLYRTGPRAACPALRPVSTLIIDVFGGSLCSGDHFRVLEPGSTIPSGACQFADFVPYQKVR